MLSQIVADIGSHIPRRGDVGTATGRRPGGGLCIAHPTTSPTTLFPFNNILIRNNFFFINILKQNKNYSNKNFNVYQK